jgi:hypothetical protein
MRTGSAESPLVVRKRPTGRVHVAGEAAVEVLLARLEALDALQRGEAAVGADERVLAVHDRAEARVAADLELHAARALQTADARPQRDAGVGLLARGDALGEGAAAGDRQARLGERERVAPRARAAAPAAAPPMNERRVRRSAGMGRRRVAARGRRDAVGVNAW